MTKLVAIINITPDSFSDGGEAYSPEDAIAKIAQATAVGADIIDIGAESTRPGSKKLSDTEEWARLEPILTAGLKAPISLDSYHPATIERALDKIAMMNDVSGLRDERMCALVRDSGLPVVMMHSTSIPADPNDVLPTESDPVTAINTWITERLDSLDRLCINLEQIIIDPGIGFGKTPEQSLELLNRVSELSTHGQPLYIGHSRKSFLSLLTDKPAAERDPETLDFSKKLIQQQVDYLRVHNVEAHVALRNQLRAT